MGRGLGHSSRRHADSTQASDATQLAAISGSASSGLFTEAILAGGVGLLAVIVSVFLLVWFGRKVTGDLTGLYTSVRGMAEERLPRVVERLRRGEDVDVLAESPPPGTSGIQEISQIARSFGIVQEAAVAAAVEQARLRKGVNQVFLNISMRNQSLLHRQLGMLDSMERRTSEPGALADLFRLDHLTTRMRRHAEGLIILSGSTPGRGWREPVPVVDVLRAAVAEVEDYVRVDVLSESRDLVAGNAVNDVIHLVAELVENATVFSPPNTRIEVRADRAGTGLVAEIEDRGLGLSQEELADINRRLANPPEFDLANSEQLGLFVVSRLAARHAIKVSLRQSVYGGTTAILVLPFGVIVREEEAGSPAEPGRLARRRLRARQAWPCRLARADLPLRAAAAVRRDRPAPAGRGRDGPAGRHRRGGPRRGRPAPGAVAPAAGAVGVRAGRAAGSTPQAPPPAPAEKPPWDAETGPSWFDAFSRTSGRAGAGPAGRGPAASAPGGASAVSRQPARRRRAAISGCRSGSRRPAWRRSCAPSRRQRRTSRTAGSAAPDIDARSPEATRNLMILMQQGWERGRVDDLDDPAGTSDNGTER